MKALKLGKHARVEASPAGLDVILYKTTIASIAPGKVVYLYAGEHKTATTKRHINQILQALQAPGHVVQKAGQWFVRNGRHEYHFRDGFEIRLDGDLPQAARPAE
jgi:hypothetical protein